MVGLGWFLAIVGTYIISMLLTWALVEMSGKDTNKGIFGFVILCPVVSTLYGIYLLINIRKLINFNKFINELKV